MLAGFIFLGILAASSFPDVMEMLRETGGADGQGGDDDGDQDQPFDEGRANESLPSAEDLPAPGEAPEPAPTDTVEDEDLLVDPVPGETEVQAFNPGVDSLTIILPDEAQEFAAHDADDEQDAYFSFETDEGTVQIQFPGLATVPVNDIFLRVSDPASPTLDADIALSQLIDDGSSTVLEPVDPTLPDDPSPPVDPEGDVLTPVDPTLPDDPAPPFEGEGPVLLPVDDTFVASDASANLSSLIQRDGGAVVGLTADGGAVSVLDAGDDAVALPDDGAGTGSITLDQAAANLQGAVTTIDLGAGDDTLSTGSAATYGFGGAGNDSLSAGPGAAALFGGADDDVLLGDPGDGQALLHGGSGDDTLIGGGAGAWLDGGEHGEETAAGNDSITGGAGDDTIRGGWGADSLSGGAGNDVIDHRGTDAQRIIAERHEFAWHIDNAADTLDGGAGDDTLTFDRGDVLTGGAGADVMWLYADGAAPGGLVAEITDFVPGEDFLRISLNPQINAGGLVEVVTSDDGLDALVQVDGTTVAILRGAPDASLADIYAETAEDVFPAG